MVELLGKNVLKNVGLSAFFMVSIHDYFSLKINLNKSFFGIDNFKRKNALLQ